MTFQCGPRRPNLNETKMRRCCDVACWVGREYNSLLPLEMQEQDEDWFDEIDEKMTPFKNKIHN